LGINFYNALFLAKVFEKCEVTTPRGTMIQEEVLKKIRYIELKAKKKVDSYLQGAYHTLFKGQGLEFQEVREYTEGDDARLIDWNVTARMGKPFVKLFHEERELTVIIMVDISGSTRYGRSYSGREVMATISAALAFSAIKNSDKVGLLLFSDHIEEYIPPRRGRNHLLTVIRTLLTKKPEKSGTNPEEVFSYLNKAIKKKALIFFLSDMFFDSIPQSLKSTQRRHEVVPIGIFDKSQFASDKSGFIRVKDPESGKMEILDFSNSGEYFWNKFKDEKEQELKRMKLEPIWIENREEFINDLIIGFRKMEKRRR